VWARVFSVYGPLDNSGTLLAAIAGRFRSNEDMDLSSGQQRWSYLYATDAGAALATLATDPRAAGIVNVGHPIAPPLRELVEEFAGNFATTARLNFAAAADPATISNLDPATDRLTTLGWRPETTTAEGLAFTARWLKGEPVDEPWKSGARIPAPRGS
jgi:nucleoside-diphosphate-sugar epimerase